MKKKTLQKDLFIPRDVSWLMFNQRVLHEAMDKDNPLLERLKFLSICVNNLDEFQMVRVAGLRRMVQANLNKPDACGYYPSELLAQISSETRKMVDGIYDVYQKKLAKELEEQHIRIENVASFRKEQKKFIRDYFDVVLYPIVTPLGVDAGHPFPVLPSKTIAFAVHLVRNGKEFLAIVPVPDNVPRVLRLPSKKNEYRFALVEDILQVHLGAFFKGYKIKSCSMFRVIRDSELDLEEESTANLLKKMEWEVKKRAIAKVVYLEVQDNGSPDLLLMLCEGLGFPRPEVVKISSHFDLTLFFEMMKQIDRPDLVYDGFTRKTLVFDNIFEKIRDGDFMIHMPYESFRPTVELVQAAARDENVLAIKMTLYRVNRDSSIIQALKEAAANKKQVTILVEIKARFDEESNIKWAKELEMMGCHVIYGIPGKKVHSKMTLIVRKEEGRIVRYVHLSTGNYNENTAKVYTDIGYFTANEDFARDVSDIFNVITGYSRPKPGTRIVSAPDEMREFLLTLIDREIKFQRKSHNGAIFAKLNSLEDTVIIQKLYEASQEGVSIRLAVRGICCLIPGVKGLSENIKVRSVVGRFLEHTRIFSFNNNANPRFFISSADWMRRNFDQRIEQLFEVKKEEIRAQLRDILDFCWRDNVKAWELKSDRAYQKVTSKDEKFHMQAHLIKQLGG